MPLGEQLSSHTHAPPPNQLDITTMSSLQVNVSIGSMFPGVRWWALQTHRAEHEHTLLSFPSFIPTPGIYRPDAILPQGLCTVHSPKDTSLDTSLAHFSLSFFKSHFIETLYNHTEHSLHPQPSTPEHCSSGRRAASVGESSAFLFQVWTVHSRQVTDTGHGGLELCPLLWVWLL